VLPTELRAAVQLAPETRRRGLFEATVYAARINFTGGFTIPEVAVPDVAEAELLWREAYVVAGSSELRPAGAAPTLGWNGARLAPDDGPVDGRLCLAPENHRWRIGLRGLPAVGESFQFDLAMELRGSSSFRIVPLARRATVEIEGGWATPSFVGTELPARSTITEEQFAATWEGGTRTPLVRRGVGACHDASRAESLGVELLEAVPTYRMVNRAAKYSLFILALVFVTCLVFEAAAKVRLHPVQYGLLGASVVLFPLLLLAVGEPLGFGAAFAISAAMVVAQASLYTWAATRRASLGAALSVVMAALFGFLHVVLSLEAYALLAGALAMFLALSLLMAVTRRV
jgi:inner membrane protein